MPDDIPNFQQEPAPIPFYGTHQADPRLAAMAPSNNDTPVGKDAVVVTPPEEGLDEQHVEEALAVLDHMGLLKNKKLCLQLVAQLTERVGYDCAGYTATINVAELMLMSARALELAERVGKLDQS